MPNKNYRRGYIVERRCMKELKKENYYPIRTAGSHSCWDVVGLSPQGNILIQCKRVKKAPANLFNLFKKELDEIEAFKTAYDTQKGLWVWLDNKGWTKIVVGDRK